MRKPRLKRRVLNLLVPLVLVTSGCAGYQMGNRTLFPTHIHTVHVPMFQSNSLRPDLGEWLTEAVVKEIELRTPYKVISDPLADSVLTGRLMQDRKRVRSENRNDEPRYIESSLVVHVTWIDNRGQILTQSIINLGTAFAPEAGQSITSAQHTTIKRIASQIVSQMEARNW
jgi:hypothetical protein